MYPIIPLRMLSRSSFAQPSFKVRRILVSFLEVDQRIIAVVMGEFELSLLEPLLLEMPENSCIPLGSFGFASVLVEPFVLFFEFAGPA